MSEVITRHRCNNGHSEIEFVGASYRSPSSHEPCPICELKRKIENLEMGQIDIEEKINALESGTGALLEAFKEAVDEAVSSKVTDVLEAAKVIRDSRMVEHGLNKMNGEGES